MALFSRRKKPAETPAVDPDASTGRADAEPAPAATAEPASAGTAGPASGEEVPQVGISVQAFRGVGAEAGPGIVTPSTETNAPTDHADGPSRAPRPDARTGSAREVSGEPPIMAPVLPLQDSPSPRLPLAPASPPAQTHTIEGMLDNVLLREALAQLGDKPSNSELLGVLRQTLQGHLFLRVHGDAREQLDAGKQLAVGVVRDDTRSFMLAFSSGAALRASLKGGVEAADTSAVAQPVAAVFRQVLQGGFTGLIIDNSSGPHRAVIPADLVKKALEHGDENTTIKSILAAPRDATTPSKVAEALATTRTWVAVSDGSNGQPVGIAEARSSDGRRFLQLFSHPLEVIVLGRNDRPTPFPPEQLATVLRTHSELAGVIVDVAGPSIVVERDALAPVLVLAVDIGD